MAESASCPTCKNKRTIPCPCCSGKGIVEQSPYPPRVGKMYICVDCAGSGEIPCPRCSPNEKKDIRLREMRPGFGHV